jgi:hypothetical protein
MAFFLLSAAMSAAQDNYDTLMIYHQYVKDENTFNYEYVLARKDVRYYDKKGRLSYVQGFEYAGKNSNPYFFYQETYTYGANDSLLKLQIDEVPRGQSKFWAREIWEYSYSANKLQEIRITKYAHTVQERNDNLMIGRSSMDWGGKMTDTSGWSTVSAIRFTYDEQGRLLKKAQYKDYADKMPATMWLYTYGNELPDLNTYFQKTHLLKKVYNHLYKNGRLALYREETWAGSIELENYQYSFNKEGLPAELEISNVKYRNKKFGEPYKKDGKEDVTHRYEYKYTNGRLTSEVVHYKYSYTKYKVSFLDRLGNMPSVSTSTTRYGDYQTSTTTVKSNYNPPPRKEDMIAKTKYKWSKHTREYEYDTNGKRVIKGGTVDDLNYRSDSKGRLTFRQTCQYKTDYDKEVTCVQYRYGYRN